MNGISIPFETINPFVRYCHVFEIAQGSPFVDVKAFDYRLMYIFNGKGYIDIDGVRYEAVKGCLFLWQPGIKYSLLPDMESPFTIWGFNFDYTCNNNKIAYPVPPENAFDFKNDNIVEAINFIDQVDFNTTIYIKSMQSLQGAMMNIINEYNTKKKYHSGKIRGDFTALLFDIARNLSINTNPDISDSIADRIIHFIKEHYNSTVTNREIGQYFNFHPIYINRLMVKHTGTSLHQYLINYRITMALNLLQTTGKSVTEIAYSVGFKDINYFSRCFKKAVGLSPRTYIASDLNARKNDC